MYAAQDTLQLLSNNIFASIVKSIIYFSAINAIQNINFRAALYLSVLWDRKKHL